MRPSGVPYGMGESADIHYDLPDDFDSFQGKMFLETLPCAAGPPVSCPDPQAANAKWVARIRTCRRMDSRLRQPVLSACQPDRFR